jgi:hypothetical protein
MKRAAVVLSSALLTVLVTAGTVLAQTTTYPPESPDTSVIGGGGGAGNVDNVGGTAFTGGDVSFGAIAFATLLVIGVVALFVARRRAARLAG